MPPCAATLSFFFFFFFRATLFDVKPIFAMPLCFFAFRRYAAAMLIRSIAFASAAMLDAA